MITERENVINSMSDREQRAFAAEVRIKQAKGLLDLCANCKASITSIPFQRFNSKYCSMACLKENLNVNK